MPNYEVEVTFNITDADNADAAWIAVYDFLCSVPAEWSDSHDNIGWEILDEAATEVPA